MNQDISSIDPLALFLQTKLNEKKLSATELARRVNYNGGPIRAIVKGTRVPKFKSPIIQKIASVLDVPLEEIEGYHLQSIEVKNSEKHKHPVAPSKKLQQLAEPLTGIGEYNGYEAREKILDYRPVQGYSCGAIDDSRKLIETKIRILKSLLNQEVPRENSIYITFFSLRSIFSEVKDRELEWLYQKTLSNLIDKGWHVFHIMRLDASARERTYELVSNTFRFFGGKGEYHPCYLDTRAALKIPYGVFLISNQEAILSLSVCSKESVGAGVFIRDSKSLEVIKLHCQELYKESKPIFKIFTSYQQPEFVERLKSSDQEPGERIIIAQRLSEITRPLDWYIPSHPWAKELIKHLKETTQKPWPNMSDHIQNRQRRAIQLVNSIKEGKYTRRYIYPYFTLEEFVNNGKPNPYYFEANQRQRIEQLEVILSLLEHDNYRMALIKDDQEDIFRKIKPSFCEVQGNHFVFMQFSKKDMTGKNTSTWYASDDPIVVRAFQERLLALWNNLPTESTDKFLISTWIRGQIKKIKSKIS